MTVETDERIRKIDLSRRLKIDRQSLDRWLALPGSPSPDPAKRFSVIEVAEWVKKCAQNTRAVGDMHKVKLEKLTWEMERVKMDVLSMRADYIQRKTIVPVVAAFNTALTANLRAKFEHELPAKYVGRNAIECQLMNIAAIDQVLLALKRGQYDLTGGAEEPPKP